MNLEYFLIKNGFLIDIFYHIIKNYLPIILTIIITYLFSVTFLIIDTPTINKESNIVKKLKEYEKEKNCKVCFILSDYHKKKDKYPELKDYIIDIDKEYTFYNFMKRLRENEYPDIELIIHSEGGLISSSDIIVNTLLEYESKITSHIPYLAQSAATSITLASDIIRMEKYAILGPIDPQINYVDEDSKEDSCSSSILKFMYENNKLDDDEKKIRALEAKIYHEDNITNTRKCLDEKHKYLFNYQKDNIIKELASGIYPHHKPYSKKALEKLGLRIFYIDKNLLGIYEELNKLIFN
tara:strand:+ start:13838 stop:14725 length:888 start_codon:yes stop_codon:yes gene_type:complete